MTFSRYCSLTRTRYYRNFLCRKLHQTLELIISALLMLLLILCSLSETMQQLNIPLETAYIAFNTYRFKSRYVPAYRCKSQYVTVFLSKSRYVPVYRYKFRYVPTFRYKSWCKCRFCTDISLHLGMYQYIGQNLGTYPLINVNLGM